jgi:hypothetical protein
LLTQAVPADGEPGQDPVGQVRRDLGPLFGLGEDPVEDDDVVVESGR